MSRLLLALLVGCVIAASSSSDLSAANLSSGPELMAKPKKPKKPEIHDTVIASVSGSSITVTEDKTSKTYAISPFTEITVNGQKANAAALKPGMLVSVVQTDATRVSRITATTK